MQVERAVSSPGIKEAAGVSSGITGGLFMLGAKTCKWGASFSGAAEESRGGNFKVTHRDLRLRFAALRMTRAFMPSILENRIAFTAD